MREKKPDKRKVQGAETKKKLYEIAQRLFAEKNFADVMVEDITDEAGITKGAFYVHFASKDALIATMISDYAAGADAEYQVFLETLPDNMSAAGVLLSLADKIVDVLADTIGYGNMQKVYQMMLAKAPGTQVIKDYGRALYGLFRGVLESGVRHGEFKSDLPVDHLARHFVMAIRGVCYEWCVRYPDFDLREQAEEHIRLLIEGIQIYGLFKER